MLKLALAAVLVSTAVGCIGEDVSTPFEGDPKKPLVDPGSQGQLGRVGTEYCYEDSASGDVVEAPYETDGEGSRYGYAEAGGCLARPIREAWAVLNNQGLMVWDEVADWDAETEASPDGVALTYRVQYLVEDIMDVEWEMLWHHSVSRGTVKTPTRVIVNYQKVYGSEFISHWKGSIVLDEVRPNMTAYFVRDEMDATGEDSSANVNSVSDIVEKLTSGDPDWSALELAK